MPRCTSSKWPCGRYKKGATTPCISWNVWNNTRIWAAETGGQVSTVPQQSVKAENIAHIFPVGVLEQKRCAERWGEASRWTCHNGWRWGGKHATDGELKRNVETFCLENIVLFSPFDSTRMEEQYKGRRNEKARETGVRTSRVDKTTLTGCQMLLKMR